ncbi:UNVERIFIED_CONTAM: hypothetical protein FKN15_075604 [Acipenser sinensis]
MEELLRLNRTEDQSQRVSEKDVAEALGRVSILQNKPASAVVFFEKAASHVIANQGQDSPELIKIYQEMAKAEQMRVRHEEAIEHLLQESYELLRSTLQSRKEAFGDYSDSMAETYSVMGSITLAGGEVKKAYKLLRKLEAGEEQYVLIASLDNARNLSNILKAIQFKDHATFLATSNGIKVTVEDSKCLQANAFIQESYELLRSTLQSRKEAFGDYSDSMAETYSVMGSITLAGGEVKKAYKLLRK